MVATSVKLFILELKNSALVTPPLSSTGFSRHLGSRQVNVWRIGPLKSLSTWNGALPPLFRTAYNMTGAGNAKTKTPSPHSISMVEMLPVKVKVIGLRQTSHPRERRCPDRWSPTRLGERVERTEDHGQGDLTQDSYSFWKWKGN